MDETMKGRPLRHKALALLMAIVLAVGLTPLPVAQAYADMTAGTSSDLAALGAGNEGEAPLADGTYTASQVTTDVTTDASGMIMVTKADVVIKDGQATAIITMKGIGADRVYVSDTAPVDSLIAEAVAEETKEIDGQFSNLLGGYVKEGETAYTFWPIPIELGQPKVYAARSASHFKKWDTPREKYYYLHDFQIDAEDLTLVSDSTDIMTPEADAQVFINQFYVNNGVSTDHAGVIKAKETAVTVPYYDGDTKISSFKFKRPDASDYVSGWFIDDDGLNFLSSSNKKKIRYPGFTNAFTMQSSKRDAGGTFTAILKLYPAGTAYNQYDANGVYYYTDSSYTTPAAPLAEQTFTITVAEKPEVNFNVNVAVSDSKTGEAIADPAIVVTDESDGSVVSPAADGTYSLNALKKYTVAASAEGYVAQGGAEQAVKTGFTPSKEGETVQLKLLKKADATHTMTFSFKDQFDKPVVNPQVKVLVYGTANEIEPNADGSYTLYDGERYRYEATAEGYETTTQYSFTLSEDKEEVVQMNKYLSEYRVFYRIYDQKTDETLEGVTLVVTNNATGESITQNEDGSFTVPADTNITCVASKEGYQDSDFTHTPSGFDPVVNCSFGLTLNFKNQLISEIAKATEYSDGIVEADEPGKWPVGTKEALDQAIASAQAVVDDAASTEDDCQAELAELKAAEKTAENARNWFESNVTVRVNRVPGGAAELYKMKVSGEASKTYRYAEPSAMGKQVSLIDVLVALHKEVYGDAFDADPTSYFDSENVGFYYIGKLFGLGNYYQFALNGGSTGSYQNCIVSDGDVIDVSLMVKTNDVFTSFENLECQAIAGETFTTTLFEGVSTRKPAVGYTVTLKKDDVQVSATTDESGALTVTLPEAGTYAVDTVTKEGETRDIVQPYLKVEVLDNAPVDSVEIASVEPLPVSDGRSGALFTLSVPEGMEGGKVKFEIAGAGSIEKDVASSGETVFQVPVAPKNLSDPLTVTYTKDGEAADVAGDFTSIDAAIAGYGEYGKGMSEYGRAAANYLTGKNLALDPSTESAVLPGYATKSSNGVAVEGVADNGYALVHNSKLYYKQYFAIDGDPADYAVTVGGKSAKLVKSGDEYYVKVPAVKSAQWNDAKTVTVAKKSGGDAYSVTFSATGYAQSKATSTKPALKGLARAMHVYYQATQA